MNSLNIYISGSGFFGELVLQMCLDSGHNVVGVAAPIGDRYIGRSAANLGIPLTASGTLSKETMPDGVDLGITASSFDYIGKKTRYRARYGWVGYHPSLLPRHRGRSSIEWAVRMGDPITGGTVYWLNSGIDRGNIAYQDWCWIPRTLLSGDPVTSARWLWRNSLQEIGITLLSKAVSDISEGVIRSEPQRQDCSTWEPNTEVRDIYRPDSLMISGPKKK